MNFKLKSFETISSLILINLLTGCQNKSASELQPPNLMIIMVDDMGFSDPGCYGGEIKTPNLDYLAQNGLRFTDFHNCAKCSPTRASLLTGAYPHEANMPNIGYTLSSNVVTLAEVLKQGGYQTGITGKWHLSIAKGLDDEEEMQKWVSHQADHGDFAPLNTYPCNRGFDEHYGVIWGVVNHFDPFSLVHNEEPIKEVPDDFYLTDFITDKSVELIDQFAQKEKPFFLYVAYTAPHWPLQAWENDIEK
ncbi:MAG: sulfatase-like hydrolase/transferase, partial [Bacteroidales bacterium]|nr:sulfatase-like hydrolase/transferase [Bacteroidales bacterium]